MLFLRYTKFVLCSIWCLPHLWIFLTHKHRQLIKQDIRRWLAIMNNLAIPIIYRNETLGFLYLLSFYPEFRSLFYARSGNHRIWLNLIYPGRRNLFLRSKNIGGGLFIQHGFATAVGAKSIGDNCLINQQVTITNDVTIGNNVEIKAGAVIYGNIKIGNNVLIGANCTVYQNLPDNCSVLPSPHRIMKWKEQE